MSRAVALESPASDNQTPAPPGRLRSSGVEALPVRAATYGLARTLRWAFGR